MGLATGGTKAGPHAEAPAAPGPVPSGPAGCVNPGVVLDGRREGLLADGGRRRCLAAGEGVDLILLYLHQAAQFLHLLLQALELEQQVRGALVAQGLFQALDPCLQGWIGGGGHKGGGGGQSRTDAVKAPPREGRRKCGRCNRVLMTGSLPMVSVCRGKICILGERLAEGKMYGL